MANGNSTDTQSAGGGGESKGGESTRSGMTYPFYGIAEGLRFADAVRRAGGNEASDNEVLAALSLTSLVSRAWSYRLSTAREFGLVERAGRGDKARIRVTDLYLLYAQPGSDDEKRAALWQILQTPTLYVKLLEKYRGAPVPPKDGLANVLARDPFKLIDTVRGEAADAFLESIEFAGIVRNGIISSALTAPTVAPVVRDGDADKESGSDEASPTFSASSNGTQTMRVPADFIIYKCKIGGGKIIDIALPPTFRQVDVDKLHAFLKTQIDDE